jgi:uncharacterized protein (DUF433 family)
MSYLEHIEIHSDIRFGRPCVRGTRISVYDVLVGVGNVSFRNN